MEINEYKTTNTCSNLHVTIFEVMDYLDQVYEISIPNQVFDLLYDCTAINYGNIEKQSVYYEICNELSKELAKMIELQVKFQKSLEREI